jgi:hypothetical protein
MINYRKKITLQRSKDLWYIETDRADRYETFAIDNTATPWSKWWEMQHQSDLRLWQKDILRNFGTKWPDLTPYMVYKRNAGHSQPHDVVLAHSEQNKVWILITERDFWFVPSDYGQVEFPVEDSMGSVLEKERRMEMFYLRDALDYQ